MYQVYDIQNSKLFKYYFGDTSKLKCPKVGLFILIICIFTRFAKFLGFSLLGSFGGFNLLMKHIIFINPFDTLIDRRVARHFVTETNILLIESLM